jgi:hypothetical protein
MAIAFGESRAWYEAVFGQPLILPTEVSVAETAHTEEHR